MHIESVNIGEPRPVQTARGNVLTGIFKEPVASAIRVERRNLAGDRQADLTVHGGIHKAVYAYPTEHYAFWGEALGKVDLSPGNFGENFTTHGLLEDRVLIGQRYRMGSALLEVSQPRFPCFKLGLRFGDPTMTKRFHASLRPGFYLRVLEEGTVKAGDPVQPQGRPEVELSVRDAYAMSFHGAGNADALAAMMEHPALAPQWKDHVRDAMRRRDSG